MTESNEKRFEREIVPHFDSGYSLARWLTGNQQDADDVLQDSSLRAYRFLKDLRSEDARSWFLQIVRNSSYTCLRKKNNFVALADPLEDQPDIEDKSPNAEENLLESSTGLFVRTAIENLPVEYREVLLLRELEELSYQEIAVVTNLPMGTVMSRLSRARSHLKEKLSMLKEGR